MSKRNVESEVSSSVKKKRRAITLETKYNIIRLYDSGRTVKELGLMFSMNQSTISSILKERQKYINEVKSSKPMQSTWIRRKESDNIISRMEKLLTAWINEETQTSDITITQTAIRAKALALFKTLKDEKGEDCEETFVASNGWYNRYKKRAGWNSNKLKENPTSIFIEETKTVGQKLMEMIEEECFAPSQIFHVDETELYWKRIPSKAFITRTDTCTPGYKAANDRFSLLLCSNATGNCKLKPMIVYRTENPKELKGIDKTTLPIVWKHNKRSLITAALFEDWFLNYFIPEVKKYCENKGIPFYVLLIMDNALWCSPVLRKYSCNVKIVLLPPDPTSSIQPMNQDIIELTKVYYFHRMFEEFHRIVDKENKGSFEDIWREFNVLDAIKTLDQAWKMITDKDVKSGWKKSCPDLMEDFNDFRDLIGVIRMKIGNIVNIAVRLNLDITKNDVDALLQTGVKEITHKEFVEMEKEKKNSKIEYGPFHSYDLKELAEAFEHIDKAIKIFKEQDTNTKRSSKVADNIKKAFICYEQIFREQTETLNKFIERSKSIEADSSTDNVTDLPINSYGGVEIKKEILDNDANLDEYPTEFDVCVKNEEEESVSFYLKTELREPDSSIYECSV